MSDLADVWGLTRTRLAASYEDLSDDQLRWRPHEDAHNIGEILYHVAGAEQYWWSRLSQSRAGMDERLEGAVKDGFLREAPSPYSGDDLSVDRIDATLAFTKERILPILVAPSTEQLSMTIESPIGDQITGREGLIRLVQHAAYHTGQIWMIRMSPGFP